MKRLAIRCLMVLAPLALAGCSTDPREGYITSAVEYINHAANEIGALKDHVEKAMKNAKDNKLDARELREANSSIEQLRDLGKKMQLVKQRTEGASLTEEEKDDLRQRYQQKVQGALTRLEEERVALQKTLQEAEAMDPEAIRELRNQLTQAEGMFAVLARQR